MVIIICTIIVPTHHASSFLLRWTLVCLIGAVRDTRGGSGSDVPGRRAVESERNPDVDLHLPPAGLCRIHLPSGAGPVRGAGRRLLSHLPGPSQIPGRDRDDQR